MAARGRPPAPDKSRFFNDFNGSVDDSAYVGVPKCPPDLDDVAKKKWKELVKLLAAMDILTKADRDLMELYCIAYSRCQAAQAMLRKFGEILKSKQGGLYRSPYLDVANHASKEMQKLAKSLGLDPLSRKKLGIARIRRSRLQSRDRSQGLPPPTPRPPVQNGDGRPS
jgi:P27 family predicted phage terminase small subunit